MRGCIIIFPVLDEVVSAVVGSDSGTTDLATMSCVSYPRGVGALSENPPENTIGDWCEAVRRG